MEIQLFLDKSAPANGLHQLSQYIKKESITGITNIEIPREDPGAGAMGIGDVLGSVKALIEAAAEPLTRLVECLLEFVKNYRTKITIPQKNGDPIVIDHGRSMSAEELKNVVTAIQQNQ